MDQNKKIKEPPRKKVPKATEGKSGGEEKPQQSMPMDQVRQLATELVTAVGKDLKGEMVDLGRGAVRKGHEVAKKIVEKNQERLRAQLIDGKHKKAKDRTVGEEVAEQIKGVQKEFKKSVEDLSKDMDKQIKSTQKEVNKAVKDASKEMAENLKKETREAANAIKEETREAAEKAKEKAREAAKKLKEGT